jgi:hypothetical protein
LSIVVRQPSDSGDWVVRVLAIDSSIDRNDGCGAEQETLGDADLPSRYGQGRGAGGAG